MILWFFLSIDLIRDICSKKKTQKTTYYWQKNNPQNIFQTNEYIFSFKVNSENFSAGEENWEFLLRDLVNQKSLSSTLNRKKKTVRKTLLFAKASWGKWGFVGGWRRQYCYKWHRTEWVSWSSKENWAFREISRFCKGGQLAVKEQQIRNSMKNPQGWMRLTWGRWNGWLNWKSTSSLQKVTFQSDATLGNRNLVVSQKTWIEMNLRWRFPACPSETIPKDGFRTGWDISVLK